MKTILDKMRADWSVVAEARRATGEWTETDEREFGEAVKKAVESKDPASIALWSRWLAELSTGVSYWNLIVRAAESGMRAKVAEEQAKRAGRGPGK